MPRATKTEIATVFGQIEEAIDRWEQAEHPIVDWIAGPTKAISEELEESLSILCQFCAATDAEQDAKPIILALDAFAAEWESFLTARDMSPESVHPSGTPELWTLLREFRRSFTTRPRRLPEPIRDLIELPDMSNETICKIYGFLDENRSPDYAKLQEEIRNPGTHYDPTTWVHPSDKKHWDKIESRWLARSPIPIESFTTGQPRQRAIAPESLDELLAQGVGSEQIANMKNMLREEVIAYAQQHGIPVDGSVSNVPSREDAEHKQQLLNQRRQQSIPNSHPEVDDMEERVLACAADGMKPSDIAEALQTTWPDFNWQRARSIIQKHQQAETESTVATA